MLKTDIKLLVKGFKKGTHETKGAFTKLQTLSVNENGAEKVEEVKIYQDISDVLNLVDKVVLNYG
jgi:RecB family endonuclease NucS